MLQRLIRSYVSLQIPEGVQLCLIVVENDLAPNMRDSVANLNNDPKHPILYAWEPRLGIPIARNRCLDIAMENNATHLAFVDDDEWFPEDWLTHIWGYYRTQPPESVIQGPVISVLPPDAAEHFLPLFQRKLKLTGDQLHTCLTNNVLVPIEFFERFQLRFDESRPLAGGTDSKLFRQAHAQGAQLIYCVEATMFEEVPPERITYRWLSKRYFRIGLTMGEHAKLTRPRDKFKHALSTLYRSLLNALKSLLYALTFNRKKHWKSWLKSCKLMGECLGAFGVRVNSYTKVEGS